MRRLRHRLLQRLDAVLLVAGVVAGVAPVAAAAPADAHGLDAAALDAARDASRFAPTREAAADVFLATYVRVSGDAGVAQSLYRLLLDAEISGVPPATPPVAAVAAAPVSRPVPHAGSVAVLAEAPHRVVARRATVRTAPADASGGPAVARGATRTRAP